MEAPSTLIDSIKGYLEVANHVVVIGATFVGGYWALRNSRIFRSVKTALDISLSVTRPKAADSNLAFVVVSLTNKGRIPIYPTRKNPAYSDDVEKIPFAATLQLKRLGLEQVRHARANGVPVDWHACAGTSNTPTDIDLLWEYYDTTPLGDVRGDHLDFFMEPAETYQLGVPIPLDPGLFLAKVTFIGRKKSDDEFWSMTSLIEI